MAAETTDASETILRRTTCNRDCPDACAIVATVERAAGGRERVVRLGGDPEHPVTRGTLCYRTNNFLSLQYSPERLTTPLWRESTDAAFQPIGWDEALDRVAERLGAIRRESGPAAIFHYRSGGSLGLLKNLSDWFFERFGPVTIKRGDICSGAGEAAQALDFGDEDSSDLFDLHTARNILVWGKNVYTSSPHLIPVLREARARGAKLMLIDPVHHKTASLCDRFVQPRPAGDLALALGVARVLFDRGWTDPDAAQWCDNLGGFRALAERRTVEAWCALADVSVDEAVEIAGRLREGPTTILVGWGMARRLNGAAIVRALDALGAITGNVGVPGACVSYYFKRRGAFDLSFLRGERAAPRTLSEPRLGEEILGASDPPVRAVWVTAGNPVDMLPDSETVARALRTRELVVVVDSFLTDTAACAHLVLPTTTLLEAEDLLGSYGHHYIGSARPVIDPPPGVRTDLEILQALARRLDLGDFLDGDARAWKERLLAPKCGPHGVDLSALEAGPVRNPIAPRVIFEGRRFATKSGRANLMTDAPLINGDDGEAPAGGGTDEYPLYLMSLSTERSQSSQWSRTKDREGPAPATVHPAVAAAAGVGDGDMAELCSPIGRMRVRVRLDPRQRQDVVLVPKGGHLRDGRCANALVRARTTDLGEGAAYYDERVRLVPLG